MCIWMKLMVKLLLHLLMRCGRVYYMVSLCSNQMFWVISDFTIICTGDELHTYRDIDHIMINLVCNFHDRQYTRYFMRITYLLWIRIQNTRLHMYAWLLCTWFPELLQTVRIKCNNKFEQVCTRHSRQS